MTAPIKHSFFELCVKRIFILIWYLTKAVNPKAASKLLYWGIEDQAFLTKAYQDKILHTRVFGKIIPNPIGVAAGFDKTFAYNDELITLGFGFAEFGTFTYRKENGTFSAKYLPQEKSLILDIAGLPNMGLANLQKQMIDRRRLPHMAGISITSTFEPEDTSASTGKDNDAVFETLEQDLLRCIRTAAPYSDFVVLNLAQPDLTILNLVHSTAILERILKNCKETILKSAAIHPPKLVVKLPLDLSEPIIPILSSALLAAEVDGVIISSYAKMNVQLSSTHNIKAIVAGKLLAEPAKTQLQSFYKHTQGKITLIASGGVFNAKDAYERIRSGATLIEIHSALLYEGPSIAAHINKELAELLRKDGFNSISEAVGKDVLLENE